MKHWMMTTKVKVEQWQRENDALPLSMPTEHRSITARVVSYNPHVIECKAVHDENSLCCYVSHFNASRFSWFGELLKLFQKPLLVRYVFYHGQNKIIIVIMMTVIRYELFYQLISKHGISSGYVTKRTYWWQGWYDVIVSFFNSQ